MKRLIISFMLPALALGIGCTSKKRASQTDSGEVDQINNAQAVDSPEHSGVKLTKMALRDVIIPLYSVEDAELVDAIDILNEQFQKHCLVDEPFRFIVQDAISKERVTLRTKNTSAQLISEVLAWQSGGHVEIGDLEVHLTMGSWDEIGEDEGGSSMEQNALPALPEARHE